MSGRGKYRVSLIKQSSALYEWYEFKSTDTRELVHRRYAALLVEGVWHLQSSDPQAKPISKMGVFDTLEKLCGFLGVPVPEPPKPPNFDVV